MNKNNTEKPTPKQSKEQSTVEKDKETTQNCQFIQPNRLLSLSTIQFLVYILRDTNKKKHFHQIMQADNFDSFVSDILDFKLDKFFYFIEFKNTTAYRIINFKFPKLMDIIFKAYITQFRIIEFQKELNGFVDLFKGAPSFMTNLVKKEISMFSLLGPLKRISSKIKNTKHMTFIVYNDPTQKDMAILFLDNYLSAYKKGLIEYPNNEYSYTELLKVIDKIFQRLYHSTDKPIVLNMELLKKHLKSNDIDYDRIPLYEFLLLLEEDKYIKIEKIVMSDYIKEKTTYVNGLLNLLNITIKFLKTPEEIAKENDCIAHKDLRVYANSKVFYKKYISFDNSQKSAFKLLQYLVKKRNSDKEEKKVPILDLYNVLYGSNELKITNPIRYKVKIY